METLLILGALAALLFSGCLVASQLARARRPELRMAREEDLLDEADGADLLIRGLEPPRASPIDRTATILEVEAVKTPSPPTLAPDSPGPLPSPQTSLRDRELR
ncbi:hypothetical protein ASF60_07115 [Methylobacterium sp. Leaf113]|uniref:hypothetical protein n=1 Tax=Methylobacterium sp. Leaf113 TaxID=1736259 RepID=UPI0006F51EA2|nr:hypothetical protein [Methylobacterium sp. Leaf113]KQP77713.1 hypothetical protein ASF60_07115 [Methylobacterium sp. Leaf113]